MLSRAYKKTAKANERAAACKQRERALLADDDASLADLEALPDCTALQATAEAEAARLARLRALAVHGVLLVVIEILGDAKTKKKTPRF